MLIKPFIIIIINNMGERTTLDINMDYIGENTLVAIYTYYIPRERIPKAKIDK